MTHKQRWLWDARPSMRYRAEYSRGLLLKIVDELPDYFTRHDIYRLQHCGLEEQLAQSGVPPWERHKHCATCSWDAYITEYLHTNGYICLLKVHNGARSGQYFLTDKALGWLTRAGWQPQRPAA